MMLTLTSQQMLQTWRLCAGLESLASDCSVERFDGVDIDSRLTALMRQWYLSLLDEGDPRLIGLPSDAVSLVSVKPDGYVAAVTCHESVRRLCSIRLSDWKREAMVVDRETLARLLPLQSNPFARAGVCDPVAWRDTDGTVRAIPAKTSSLVVEAKAIIDPGENTYRLDSRALSTVNEYLSKHFL